MDFFSYRLFGNPTPMESQNKTSKVERVANESVMAYLTFVVVSTVMGTLIVIIDSLAKGGDILWSSMAIGLVWLFFIQLFIMGFVNTLFLNVLRIFKSFRVTFKICVAESLLSIICYSINVLVTKLTIESLIFTYIELFIIFAGYYLVKKK